MPRLASNPLERDRPYPPYLHPPVTASVFWATALRVQEFDKGRGPVGFPADRAGLLTCPYSPIRVLARVPLSNSGAGRSPRCQYPPVMIALGWGGLNRGLAESAPRP